MREAVGSSPSVSTTSEQSPLCSGLFFAKISRPPAPLLLLFAKSHARLTCSVVNALTTVRCRYQLFASCVGVSPPAKTVKTSPPQAAYRLRRLFCKSRRRAHSAAPPFRKRSRRAFAARLQARSQRAGLLPAFFGLRLRLFFPRGPRVTAVRSFAASLCAASVP